MCSAHCSTLKMTCFLPPSLTPATPLPPPPPPPPTLPAPSSSRPPSLLASLSYLFYSLDPSLSLALLHHSLSHSLPYIALPHPILSHSPASLIHIFFTQSLPHFPLPNFPALLSPSITPLPPSFTFSSLSHCLITP